MLKAILFDLDDTLIDWKHVKMDWNEYQAAHLNRVFDYVCEYVHPLENRQRFHEAVMTAIAETWAEAKETLLAPHLGQVLMSVLESEGVPRELIDIETCLEAYDLQPVPGIVAFPDVVEALPVLKASGLKFGIVTNAFQPMFMRDAELRSVGLMNFFEDACRVSAADAGYLKPHARIFETALKELALAPEEAVFVGDNLRADIAGAQAAGMKAIWRKPENGMSEFDEGTDREGNVIIPDGTIVTLSEIYPILDNLYEGWR